MSKEEFLKTQTCVLKVNIHCEGCKAKVKKVLHKIEGVYTTAIDSELGKVTVSGNVEPATLIKKLNKKGKFAEIWGAPTKNQLPSNVSAQNQMKNLQISNGKGGNNKNQQAQKGAPVNNSQSKGGAPPQAQNPQIQQLQHMKALQDLKNHMKVAPNDKDKKPAKVNSREEEGLSDDEFETDDEFDDYDDDDEDEFDDEIGAPPVNKTKPPAMGNPRQQMANMMKNVMNGQQQQQGMMKNGANGANNSVNMKKPAARGNIPVQFNSGDGGKKGGGGNNNSNGVAGKSGNGKGGKTGGGAPPQDGKNPGGGENKNAGGGPSGASNYMGNGSKKGAMMMNDAHHGMPNMNAITGGMGPTGNIAMAHPHITQIPNNPNPQPFPASAVAAGYFPSPDQIAGIPYNQQQQYAAMMMNMQRANGNERFQPMVYARPPPAVSYMPPSYPPPPQPYPYYQQPISGNPGDEYAIFSDENTQSCSVM